MRALEVALEYAKQQCDNYGWQLLDESVALIKWRPYKHNSRLCIRRAYQFEYTRHGTERGHARLMLAGHDMVVYHAETKANSTSNSDVINFAKYRQRDASND